MTALATTTDVSNALGRSLVAGAETTRATALILLASAAVEAETGYRFAPGSYTVGRNVRSRKVNLPAKVAAIVAVRSIHQLTGAATTLTVTTDYTSRGSVIYGLHPCFVEVDFTVTAAIPTEVVGVVAGMVANTISGPPVGAASEAAGPFSISYVNSSGKVWLSASDKAILGRYRQAKPALDLL